MRLLDKNEVKQVSGAGETCSPSRGNNGWGNGGTDGINAPKVDGGFKEWGDSWGDQTTGGGRTKCAR